MAQFKQPDFSRGDPNTLGGYTAVHDRPAAFEGADGFSYSVEILADEDPTAAGGAGRDRWGAYLFFVKWARIGASAPEGHVESDVLSRGATEEEARERVGAIKLADVKLVLDTLIAQSSVAESGGAPKRKWWDAMADDDGEDTPA
jgi:hypothetical protein